MKFQFKELMELMMKRLARYSTSALLKSENIVRSFNSEIVIIHSKKTTRLNTNLRLTLLFFKCDCATK